MSWSPRSYSQKTLSHQSLTGYKFETLSLIPDHWNSTSREYIENREKMIVNNYAQYCSVVKTNIGASKLIIGGEVDAGKPMRILNYEKITR